MRTLTVELPPEIDPDEARLLLAIGLYREGKLSLGRAAELSGYSRRTFMELLGRRSIPIFNNPTSDLEQEVGENLYLKDRTCMPRRRERDQDEARTR